MDAFYDRLARHYHRAGLEAQAIDRLWPAVEKKLGRGVSAGGRWLDVGCGTAALLTRRPRLPLIRFGLDRSLAMIAKGRAPGINLIHADLATPPLAPRRFVLITAFFDVFNHLPDNVHLAAAFAALKQLLSPGGLLAFDLSETAHLRMWHGVEDDLSLGSFGILRRRARWLESRGRLEVEHVLVTGDGEQRIGTLTERAYPAGVIRSLLAQAGFCQVEKRVIRRHRRRELRSLWFSRVA